MSLKDSLGLTTVKTGMGKQMQPRQLMELDVREVGERYVDLRHLVVL
jgi:hypothetical protein